jgi:hypothetical protein
VSARGHPSRPESELEPQGGGASGANLSSRPATEAESRLRTAKWVAMLERHDRDYPPFDEMLRRISERASGAAA